MTRIILIALTAASLSTAAFAQSATEQRSGFRAFVEGLRESYDASTDGDFHSYVETAAAEAGIAMPERGPKGEAQGPDRGQADRPDHGEGGHGGGRG